MIQKTQYDKILCENTTLKISKLLNIDHLNYIYANVMQQPDLSSCDHSSCGLFVIAYAIDIAFNLNVEKSKYVVFQMRQHLRNCLDTQLLFLKYDILKISSLR
jgi:hypothetical protein